MASTSASERLLECCLSDGDWSEELLRASLAEDDGRAFFRIVVERLGDLFEPRLCDVYARLFSQAIGAPELVDRYQRVRQVRRFSGDAQRVYVLSRITLGADVAVTSIVLDGLKKRFPKAELYFVGPRKNWELFAADPRIQLYEFAYPRAGTLHQRLTSRPSLEDGIVIDPDSRLSQLGLLPVCNEERYYFFESRAYGGESDASLGELTRDWILQTFDVEAESYVAPLQSDLQAEITVSLGVGENENKRLGDQFEELLITELVSTGKSILIDEGAGGEETARVRRLCAKFPSVQSWNGPYAPFASAIQRSSLYVGYDSAGQHVAAAAGTPLKSYFAGYPSERFFHRWRPTGRGQIEIVT